MISPRSCGCQEGHRTRPGLLWPYSPTHSPLELPSQRNGSGEQSHRLRGKIQLVCFSVGKIAQLQLFVLWEICLHLFPESTQMVCRRQNTQPPRLGLSAASRMRRLRGLKLPVGAGGAPCVLWISEEESRRVTGNPHITNLPPGEEGQPSWRLPR